MRQMTEGLSARSKPTFHYDNEKFLCAFVSSKAIHPWASGAGRIECAVHSDDPSMR
jgi:hypothetical protein